ncbi:hypothetical protein BH24CHL6_BH24CHL6_14550 [soil metagenome]
MLPAADDLNELDEQGFATAVGRLFEGAPRFVKRLADARPFRTYEELTERGLDIALSMPEDAQIELLDSHPRIGAQPGTVSDLSYREQGYGREQGTAELQARLGRLNEAYERRFGFRFVIFVAGRPRSAIADIIEQHLEGEREDEKRRALRDVVAIARDRAHKLGEEET